MSMLSYEEALQRLLAQAGPRVGAELVDLEAAAGRVLAQDIVAPLDLPAFDNSAMDGYALSWASVREGVALPVTQRIPAGATPGALQPGSAARIFTGAPMPDGADTVVMQEDCELAGDAVLVRKLPKAGANLRRRGEDVASGQVVLTRGTRLRAQELGLLAAIGLPQVTVFSRLRVAMFFTGDELVAPGRPLTPGQIYNANRTSIGALLRGLGCEVVDLGTVPDDLDATVAALQEGASKADVLLTCGGVSVGEEDHVKAAVERIGKLDMWRVAVKPGKPLAFGEAAGKPFIGLPGNPVSAFMVFCFFARPWLLCSQGVSAPMSAGYWLPADFEWTKPSKRREWQRASVSERGIALLANQGSAALVSLCAGEGVVVIPEGKTVTRGGPVRFHPYAELLS